MKVRIRIAGPEHAALVARLLIDFNTEYDDPVPTPAWLTQHIRELLEADCTDAILLEEGDEAVGLAVQRYRPSLWPQGLECYLAELYVTPGRRGRGLGRRLLTASMERASRRGATYMDLTTTSTDTAALRLYESAGFDRHEGRGPGVDSYYYELELAPTSSEASTPAKLAR